MKETQLSWWIGDETLIQLGFIHNKVITGFQWIGGGSCFHTGLCLWWLLRVFEFRWCWKIWFWPIQRIFHGKKMAQIIRILWWVLIIGSQEYKKNSGFSLLSYLACSQIWLNRIIDDHHFIYITKLGKKNPKYFGNMVKKNWWNLFGNLVEIFPKKKQGIDNMQQKYFHFWHLCEISYPKKRGKKIIIIIIRKAL